MKERAKNGETMNTWLSISTKIKYFLKIQVETQEGKMVKINFKNSLMETQK
jgi:hypothetical protein